MDGLRTTRVLVLDDEIEEAELFMGTLAQRGIGSIRFSGEVDKLPAEDSKLTGIRLAAIDMDLDGSRGDATAVVARLITTMNRILGDENGPYLAVAWTKHEDYITEFRERQVDLDCPPICIIDMPKDYYGEFSVISEKVDGAIRASYPLGLLGFWEQSIHQSSSSAIEMLPNSGDWLTQSRKTLRLLLNSATNKEDSAAVKLGAILSALNSLQLDAIESIAANQDNQTAGSLVSPLTTGPSPTDEDLEAAINYRLLCSNAAAGVAPGNIYPLDSFSSVPTGSLPALKHLIFDAAKPGVELGETSYRRQLEYAGCVPVAMEITPLCDYQKRAQGIPRFVCGLAVPRDARSLLKERADFLRATEPIAFDAPPLEGKRSLVWNSHYIVSVRKDSVKSDAGLVRLRQSPLIDVQAWLGSQGNRPGYLSIRIP